MATQIEEDRAVSTSPTKRIFISYSRKDYDWVHDYLKRALAAAELKIEIDDESFKTGDDLKATITKFIKECHYTLLVLTPDWVDSKWANYEGLLAAEEKLAAEDRRILPIKLKNCQIPPHIAPLLYLDLCDIDSRDDYFVDFLRDLGVSDGGITKAKSSIAKKTLQLLVELMDEPAIRDQVSNLREILECVEERISVLVANKTLHDNFQNVQMSIKQLSRAIQKQASDDDQEWSVQDEITVLYQYLRKLLAYAATVKLDHAELAFTDPLNQMAEDIHSAADGSDRDTLELMVTEISIEIDFWLPLINDRIFQIVKDRPLEPLIECLQTVYERATLFEFDEATEALLAEFKSAFGLLVTYQDEIVQMNEDHSMLQRTEVKLHLFCKSGDPTLHQISGTWRYIEPCIRKLRRSDSYQRLFAVRDRLCGLLNDLTTVRDDKFAREVASVFRQFISQASIDFNELDVKLLSRCNDLANVDFKNKLREIIKRMQNREANI